MTTTRIEGQAISIGYEWRQRIAVTATPPLFPAGCALAAHVRSHRLDPAALAVLTTANGGIVRVSDTEIDVVIPPASTAAMVPGAIVFDLARTDVDPDVHLGFALTVEVVQPVTRGAA